MMGAMPAARGTPAERAEAARDESGTDIGAACVSKEMVGDDLHARVVIAHNGGPHEVEICWLGADVAAFAGDAIKLDKVGDQRICAAVEHETGALPTDERVARLQELADGGPWRMDPWSLNALEIRQRMRAQFGA
jgi:hypothetical protein